METVGARHAVPAPQRFNRSPLTTHTLSHPLHRHLSNHESRITNHESRLTLCPTHAATVFETQPPKGTIRHDSPTHAQPDLSRAHPNRWVRPCLHPTPPGLRPANACDLGLAAQRRPDVSPGCRRSRNPGYVPLHPSSPERGVGPAPNRPLEPHRKLVACPQFSAMFPIFHDA